MACYILVLGVRAHNIHVCAHVQISIAHLTRRMRRTLYLVCM